jgi:hypothetical protein
MTRKGKPAEQPKLPSSVNRARDARAQDETDDERQRREHRDARRRQRELKKRKETRKRKVEAAMRSLSLTERGKSQVFAFVTAFESTYYKPGNGLSGAMSDTAAFAYTKLTGKPIDQGIQSGSLEQFLEEVFKAYEIDANPQHCIRQLKRSGGDDQ